MSPRWGLGGRNDLGACADNNGQLVRVDLRCRILQRAGVPVLGGGAGGCCNGREHPFYGLFFLLLCAALEHIDGVHVDDVLHVVFFGDFEGFGG